MDEVLQQIEEIKAQANKSIQELNARLEEQAQAVSDGVDILEDYVPVSHRDGFFLNYKKYMKLVEEQQVIYNNAINGLIGLYSEVYKKGKEAVMDKVEEAFTAGYQAGKTKEKASYLNFAACYEQCIAEQDEKIEKLQKQLEIVLSTQIEPDVSDKPILTKSIPMGKALELTGRKVEEIISLYIQEKKLSIRAISKETGCSRNQIERIVKGKLKHKKSKAKVLRVINKLLKVNQNTITISKLNSLKELYVSD